MKPKQSRFKTALGWAFALFYLLAGVIAFGLDAVGYKNASGVVLILLFVAVLFTIFIGWKHTARRR